MDDDFYSIFKNNLAPKIAKILLYVSLLLSLKACVEENHFNNSSSYSNCSYQDECVYKMK